jgi:hypothetical protein
LLQSATKHSVALCSTIKPADVGSLYMRTMRVIEQRYVQKYNTHSAVRICMAPETANLEYPQSLEQMHARQRTRQGGLFGPVEAHKLIYSHI